MKSIIYHLNFFILFLSSPSSLERLLVSVNAHYVEMDILLIGSIANKNDSVQAVHIHMQRSVNPRVTA